MRIPILSFIMHLLCKLTHTYLFFWIVKLTCFVTFAFASTNVANERLPFCEVSSELDRIVLVSTLDGKITALDPTGRGAALWNVHPGNEPMLSSSIHRLELTNYGQLIRMIPSLNGGLYKFNGETVEPIPLTADHLLQASFRYSDDLVISGGKESQTLGVSLRTGEVLYECSMRGCKEESGRGAGDVLLVQRMGQVVRAVEPRSGSERWNFSVAQHELKLLSECHSTEKSLQPLNLKVIVPEGLICAMDEAYPSVMLWKHKFDSPVVSAWEIQKDHIMEIDLFSRVSHTNDMSPSLYIGMHEKQLYIQESVTMLSRRQELSMGYGKNLISTEKEIPRLPWRPIVANTKNAGLNEEKANEVDTSLEEAPTTALSVLYSSPYVNGMGFYLYTKEEIKLAEEALCNVTIPLIDPADEEGQEETPATVVIVSLWYWWREVVVISLTTAVLFNVLFTRRYLLRFRGEILQPIAEPPVSRSDSGVVVDTAWNNSESQSVEYVSRYLTDFDPVRCLGKGGFGVVFEARNKIDDCHYAIKRIVLPDSPESRERVMREVRALAKLDHNHIVRYFNSWVECPPPGWQRDNDKLNFRDDDLWQSEPLLENTTSCFPSPSESLVSQSSVPYNELSHSEVPSKKNDEISDSFIVFASDSRSSACDKKEEIKEHSIVIDNSGSQKSNLVVHKSRRRPKKLEWTEHSTICHSPTKVYLYIQMQLCQRESLKDWLLRNPSRDYQSIMGIFEQIVKAVDYVHYHNLIHRDLKEEKRVRLSEYRCAQPSNIFFSMNQQIKVGDFGLVTTDVDSEGRLSPLENGPRKGHTSQVGTQLYMSPEQLKGRTYSSKVDIFSLGLILFELLVPFTTQMERLKVLQSIKHHQFPPSFIEDFEVEYDLLTKMLSHNPDERPTTIDLLLLPPLQKEDQSGVGLKWSSEMTRHRRESSRTSVSSVSSNSDICLEVK